MSGGQKGGLPEPDAELRQRRQEALRAELELPNKANVVRSRIPVPVLTAAEQGLGRPQRALRIILRQAEAVNCYNFISMPELVFYLNLPAAPDLQVEGRVGFQSGPGPHAFFLAWAHDLDKLRLLTKWVAAEVSMGLIPALNPTNLSGTSVLAFCTADACWYRAKVRNVDAETEMAEVYHHDTGTTELCPVGRLRPLPRELEDVPALAFQARLADIDFGTDPELDYFARLDFLAEVRRKGAGLVCRVKRLHPVTGTADVSLRTTEDPPRSLNEVVRAAYYRRKQTAPRPSQGVPMQTYSEVTQVAYLSREIEIKEYRDRCLKGLKSYRVVYVLTPALFYVHNVTKAKGGTLDWKAELQAYYESHENAEEFLLRTRGPILHRCYAWKHPIERVWERVRVTSVSPSVELAGIFCLDTGREYEVDWEFLREISPRFIHHAAQAILARLAHLNPLSEDQGWDDESAMGFEDLALGNVFHAMLVEREELTDETIPRKSASHSYILHLVLVEKNKAAACSINSMMCFLGYAAPDGPSSGRLRGTLDPIPDRTFVFGDMRAALLRDNPRRVIEERYQMPARTGLGGVDTETMKLGSGTSTSDTVQSILVPKRGPVRTYASLASMDMDKKSSEIFLRLPAEIRFRLGMYYMSHINSPSCFYLQSVDLAQELKTMMLYLGDEVRESKEMLENDMCEGHLVAAVLLDDRDVPTWHRAIIKKAIYNLRLIKVFLVDYGNEVSLKYSAVRWLPRYFWNIPAYAQRAHLDIKDLVPLGGTAGWTCDAAESFRKYLTAWETAQPIYYVWRRNEAASIPLAEFNQELEYDYDKRAWVREERLVPLDGSNRAAGHVLAQKLLVSLGVDVVYEMVTRPEEPYKFERVWDALLYRGFGLIKPVEEKKRNFVILGADGKPRVKKPDSDKDRGQGTTLMGPEIEEVGPYRWVP